MTGRRGKPTASAEAAVRWRVLVVVLVCLLVSNVLVNRFLDPAAYVPWNVGLTVLLVALARREGLTWSDLGLHRATALRSLRWGLAGAAVVAAVYVVGAALPATRSLFVDARVGEGRVRDLLYHAVIQIPLGTVLLEEVAFRGVLPAVIGLRGVAEWRWTPVVGASVLFGLWHVLPSIDLAASNVGVDDAVGGSALVTITLAVVGATVAGIFLCRWRWLGRGLLAPVLVHIATNSFGYGMAWFLAR